MVHSGMGAKEAARVLALHRDGVLKALVAPANMCWELDCGGASLVVVMDSVFYDGREHRSALDARKIFFVSLWKAAV